MGIIQHKAIIVTGADYGRKKSFTRAHNKAKKLFKGLVSRKIKAVINEYQSFLFAHAVQNWDGKRIRYIKSVWIIL